MTDSTYPEGPSNCLGRTCLKWGTDGELTALDLSLVMERLAQVDEEVAALYQDTPDCQPCASRS
jgi:hypothetical protein